MPEFEVNQPGVCSICGQEKEAEELSELDGQIACLDCIAEAKAADLDPNLQQIAAATQSIPLASWRRRRSILGWLVFILVLIGVVALTSHDRRLRQRETTFRTSVNSLKSEADRLANAGQLEESLARYEAVLKQLQGRPLDHPQLVYLYHETERCAATPYHNIIIPKLERIEAILSAGDSEEARQRFRELANFINAHSFQPEISIRQRIDRVTDQLRIPRIARANWRKEMPAVATSPAQTKPADQPVAITQHTPAPSQPDPTPDPQPIVTPTAPPSPPKPAQPISIPDPTSQASAQEQVRARFADKYAQRDALGRRALAHLLLITAQEPAHDPATRFVLLRESHDLAIRAAEPRIALTAIDEMAKSFLVNDSAMRVKALADSAQNAFTTEANELIAETGLHLADRMLNERRYDEAYRCALIANTAAQQSRQQSLIAQTSAKLKELKP